MTINKGISNSRGNTATHHTRNFFKACNSWLLPYLKSRISRRRFTPLLSFLYTDLKCNLACPYCFSRSATTPGMSLEMAKDAVDWLHTAGCRVLAYMGGEPLIRKDLILEVTRYAARKGFFVYLATNGILLDEDLIDGLGQAGIATINLAVDAVDGNKGLPKYFERIKPQFEYLVQQGEKYGYITFFNINITRRNLDDVKRLTEIARDYAIATDYHISEPPLPDDPDRDHCDDGAWITEEAIADTDAVIDWLIEKNAAGYNMVNSIAHLRAMKSFIRKDLAPWPCRAGELTVIIRLDGTLVPCMQLLGSSHNWGSIYQGAKFDIEELARQKEKCSPFCLSTCNYQTCHYSGSMKYSFQWLAKHAHGHFFGTS
jgi:MoaA/NifB/PqqE/SkfB family radical SAM enzyme